MRNIILANIALLTLIPLTEAVEVIDFRPPAQDIEQYGKFEFSFNLNTQFANPFDPQEIDIQAVFRTPEGETVRVFAYNTQDMTVKSSQVPFKQKVWELREYLPASPSYWQVRFTPKTAGSYQYYLEIDSDKGSFRYPEKEELNFRCLPSNNRGFLHTDPRNYHYLRFDNGESYWGVGFNGVNTMGACDQGHVRSIEVMIRSADCGANLMQIDICEGDYLEWTKLENRAFTYYQAYRGLGRYNLQVASQIDRALAVAESLGIYLRFTFYHWGDFATEFNVGEQTPGFVDSPYFFKNGGPCRRPLDFFQDPQSLRYQKQLFRYVVARWGYSPNILCWVLWNEVDLVKDFEMRTVGEWHKKMMSYLREIDENHLITTSFADLERQAVFCQYLNFDVLEIHNYISYSQRLPYRIEDNLLSNIAQFSQFRLPILPGEFGYYHNEGFGEALSLKEDEKGVHIHDQFWASLMTGAGIAGMPWHWQNYLHKFNLYPRIHGIANFIRGEDFGIFQYYGEDKVAVECGNKRIRYVQVELPTREQKAEGKRGRIAFDYKIAPNAHTLGLISPHRALIWVKDSGADFIADNPANYLDDILLRVSGMNEGEVNIEFWDTEKGVITSTTTGEVIAGKITLKIPRFTNDIALKIYR